MQEAQPCQLCAVLDPILPCFNPRATRVPRVALHLQAQPLVGHPALRELIPPLPLAYFAPLGLTTTLLGPPRPPLALFAQLGLSPLMKAQRYARRV